MLPFIEKYRAKSFEDIKGQDQAILDIKNFFENFPKKKALILNGPAGTGKTSMVLALAKENDLELFELNASDLRNKRSLEEVLKPATAQHSLFGKGKLILMDEADGITTSDRGGLPLLIKLIEETSFPIIITSNDIWNKKFKDLRKKCPIVDLKFLMEGVIIDILRNVLEKEVKKLRGDTIFMVAKKSRGDVRAALNDLQSVFDIGEEDYIADISERERKESIFDSLKKIFQGETNKETIRIFDNLDMTLDEILLWIEENIPLEYQGNALTKAFDALSKADIFKGRIYRQQYWRFLVYENFFLSAGISSARKLKSSKFVPYKRPSRILKIWLANQKNAKIKAIVNKYAGFCHMSKKKAMKEKYLLPFILDNIDEKTARRMDIDEKEIEYIKQKKTDLIVLNNLNKFRLSN